jgi:GTP cyclohydrolase I
MPENSSVVIGIGSNIDRERNLPLGIRGLCRHPQIQVERVSQVYESPAVASTNGAPDFFNAAVLARTDLEPSALRRELRAIEARQGRTRGANRNAPRTLDLDIIYYADLVQEFDGWRIPDPHAATAAHVAIPVAEIAPDLQHPETGVSTKDIAGRLASNESEVRPAMGIDVSAHYTDPVYDAFDDGSETYSPRMEELVRAQLEEIGEDPDREGLVRTPLRVAKALDYLTSGYETAVEQVINGAIFDAEGAEEMVTVKGIEFYSMCEHHLLPFFGHVTVAYLPKDKIIGLSKIARIIEVFARRLQVQERFTNQIADAIETSLDPHGVAVIVEGKHLCMMMRGVQKQESSMITSAMRGTFQENARTRSEFLELVRS